jgi:hypothetical protein
MGLPEAFRDAAAKLFSGALMAQHNEQGVINKAELQ